MLSPLPSTPPLLLSPPSTHDSCNLLTTSFPPGLDSNFSSSDSPRGDTLSTSHPNSSDSAKNDTLTTSTVTSECLNTSSSQSSSSGGKKRRRRRESDYIDVEEVDEIPLPVQEVINEGKVVRAFKEIAAHTCSFCGEFFMNLDPFNEHVMSHFYPADPIPRSPSSDQGLSVKMVNRNFFKKHSKGDKTRGSVAMTRQHLKRKAIQVGKKPAEPTVVKKKRSHRSRGPHSYPATDTALESMKEELRLDTYKCLDCGVEFVTSLSLRNHMDTYKHVSSAISRPARRTALLDTLRCFRCDKDFVTSSALLHHSRAVHKMNV